MVFAIILAVIGVILLIVGIFINVSDDRGNRTKAPNVITRLVGAVFVVVALVIGFASSNFTQDVGEASVLRDWTGNVVGYESASGFHSKSPFVDVITFDIRNQRVVYVDPSTSKGDNNGGASDGPQITVVDKDGVTDQVDLTVRYSLDPTKVTDIYKNFKTEANLKSTLIFNDIRSVTRSSAGKFTTLELIGSGRDKVSKDIETRLTEKWSQYGVIVDEVSLQQVLPPTSVQNSYSEAQKSQIEVQKATNDLAATKVSAQQKVVQAQAQADANNLLSASLSPQVLQSKYLDALKNGTVYVVPAGSTPFIQAK